MLLLAASLLFFPHYEGTQSPDSGFSLTTDAAGNAYVATYVQSLSYLSKLDPDGKLIYRVAPMAGFTSFTAVALDAADNAYVGIWGAPLGAPPTGPTYVYGPSLAKIDPAGNVLLTLTLPSLVAAIAVGADGSIYLTGTAFSNELQTTSGAFVSGATAAPGQLNAYAMKLSPTGQVLYATFLDNAPATPEDGLVGGSAIAVDAAGDAYIGGTTYDPQFPTTTGAFQTRCCGSNTAGAFLLKLSPTGSSLVYSTFLPVGDTPTAILLDDKGNANVAISQQGGSDNGLGVPLSVSTAHVSAGGDQVTGLLTVPLTPSVRSGFLAATPDGAGNVLVTTGNTVQIVRETDGAILFSSTLPAGAAGQGIAPDGSGGFIVLGSRDGVADNRPLAMLTRFVPVTAPNPAILGVANVAGDAVSAGLAPGEIVGIYGTGLGPQSGVGASFTNGLLPMELAGTDVFFNGMRAPIIYAGSNQVNTIVPFEIAGGSTVNVEVQVNGTMSNTAQLPELAAEPEIFARLGAGGAVGSPALALNQDGTLNSDQNPAQQGSIVTFFVSGAGLLTPTPADGSLAPLGPVPGLPFSVQCSDSYYPTTNPLFDCPVFYAGAAPDEVAGLVQVNFQIPGTPPGNPLIIMTIPIQVTAGGMSGVSNVWLVAP
jgi:uncharacterized protein (TIGR03437 family)